MSGRPFQATKASLIGRSGSLKSYWKATTQSRPIVSVGSIQARRTATVSGKASGRPGRLKPAAPASMCSRPPIWSFTSGSGNVRVRPFSS